MISVSSRQCKNFQFSFSTSLILPTTDLSIKMTHMYAYAWSCLLFDNKQRIFQNRRWRYDLDINSLCQIQRRWGGGSNSIIKSCVGKLSASFHLTSYSSSARPFFLLHILHPLQPLHPFLLC